MKRNLLSPIVGLLSTLMAPAIGVVVYWHGQSIGWTLALVIIIEISTLFGLLTIAEASRGFVTDSTKSTVFVWTTLVLGAGYLMVFPPKFVDAVDVQRYGYFLWLNFGMLTLSMFAVVTRYWVVWSAELQNQDEDVSPREWSQVARLLSVLLLFGWLILGLGIPQNLQLLIGWFDATGQYSTAAAARHSIEKEAIEAIKDRS